MSNAGGNSLEVITAAWPAPPTVRTAFTLRTGGVSSKPFDSLNVGAQVGDSPSAVAANRERVREHLALRGEPAWLEQVHGTRVVDLDAGEIQGPADAVIARRSGGVCVVQVADCLPVFLAARDGSAIAAAHAGWRGLAAGVLEATIAALDVAPQKLIAWLGPAISARHFEVGEEVRAAFIARAAGAVAAFSANERGRWQCDLVALARQRLEASGLRTVFGGEWCTYADRRRFFSYRRDGQCGRMAALIWLA